MLENKRTKDEVIYIGPNWTIVEDPDDAIMVKIISPDGSVKFGFPVDEDNADELSEKYLPKPNKNTESEE